MWHGRLKPELNTCSSIDYKHKRSTVERPELNTCSSIDYKHKHSTVENDLMKGVSPAYAQQSHLQRPGDSYSEDLRESITGGLFAKESYHGETKGSVKGQCYDYRDSSSGSSYLDDLRSTISKSTRAAEVNTYGESQSGPFDRDLRNMIGTNMRVTDTGSNEVETAHSRENASSYYARILDSSGHQIRELSSMSYPGKNSGLDQFARNSQETINNKDFSFLNSSFKGCGDQKIGWSKGSNVFIDSMSEHKKQISEDRMAYQQPDYKISQAASCLIENSRLLMSLNQNSSRGSLNSGRSQDVTNLSHSHLLASSGLGVNLQANLYPGKELMMINSLQTPIVVSTPLQIMEAAAAGAAANKTAGPSTGDSFWDSLKKEGLLSYQKPHAKSAPEELDVTDVVGEDFQMPDVTVKRSSKVKRSISRSPVGPSNVSSRRSPDRQRTSPFDRNRRSASPRQNYDRSEKELRGLQRDISSRQLRITTGKHNASKDKRIRSRSPERMSGHRRRSRKVSPCRIRERSPRDARSRSPYWGRMSPSRVRETTPERSKNVLRRSRDLSPHHLRDTSPQMPRQISSQRYRDKSPQQYRDISPPQVREMSPQFQRARSPQRLRDLSARGSREFSPHRMREHSPQRSKEFSPRRSRAFSPRSRVFSPHRSRELSPRRLREFSPGKSREFSPKRLREFSPRRSREFSPRRSRDLSPRRTRDLSPRRSRPFSPQRSRHFSPQRSREISPRMQRERPRVTRGSSPEIFRERSPLTRDLSQHSKERERNTNRRVRDSPLGDFKLTREHSPRIVRSHSKEMSLGRLRYRKAHSISPRFDIERSAEHFRGSSADRVRRYPLERDRGYSPVPVRVLSPERPSHQQRGYSPVSLRSLSPESICRYPLEPLVRQSPEYQERSASRVMHSAEEDVESPRRSWDLRLNPKRKRMRRRVRRGGKYPNTLDTSQKYHRENSVDLPKDQVRKTARAVHHKQTPVVSPARKTLPSGCRGESASIDIAREASPISITSNDDKEFGQKSQSPLFDEVSRSPRSTRASSPGTPTSDEKPKPVSNCYDLPKGSPVSVADLSEERGDEDRKSVDLPGDLSPVSLEENIFFDVDARNDRAGSPISDEETLIVTDSIDAQDSPVEADGDKEGEDLRVQILRLREEKVERRLKKLDEESKETELRLQNLSPELLDYSPMRDTPSPLLDECDDERRPEHGNRKFYGY